MLQYLTVVVIILWANISTGPSVYKNLRTKEEANCKKFTCTIYIVL